MAYNNKFCKTGQSKSSPLTKKGCGCGYGKCNCKSSPATKKVPNCVPKGKLKKEKGDPCWKNYVQRGMKTK